MDAREALVKKFEAFTPWVIAHSDTCTFEGSDGPHGDFCECDKRGRVQRWREVLQELRSLEAAAAQPPQGTAVPSWAMETMQLINKLTPDIKDKAFDPDWFLLRQRLEEFERRMR